MGGDTSTSDVNSPIDGTCLTHFNFCDERYQNYSTILIRCQNKKVKGGLLCTLQNRPLT